MRMPVTAITIFLPIVEAQKLGARLSRGTAASVLIFIFPMPQEGPEPILTQLFIMGARTKHRQGCSVARAKPDLAREMVQASNCSNARKASPRWLWAQRVRSS